MSKTTPEQVKAAGKRLIDSGSKRMTQYLADLSVERQAITADNLSREVLIELLAVARVNLRNAKADKESASEQHHRNSEAHWEHADKLAVKRERKPRGKGAAITNSQYIEPKDWVIKEWQRTKEQHLYRGKPSKADFVRHITEIRADIGTSIYKKNTGLFPSPSTIEKRWLNGLD